MPADGSNHFRTLPGDSYPRPIRFPAKPLTTQSADPDAYGRSWPAWQRDLHPVTYIRDADAVARQLRAAQRNLADARRSIARAVKAGDAILAASHRRSADRYARHVRNCETQLRLIAMTGRQLVAAIEAMPTTELEQLVGAA